MNTVLSVIKFLYSHKMLLLVVVTLGIILTQYINIKFMQNNIQDLEFQLRTSKAQIKNMANSIQLVVDASKSFFYSIEDLRDKIAKRDTQYNMVLKKLKDYKATETYEDIEGMIGHILLEKR